MTRDTHSQGNRSAEQFCFEELRQACEGRWTEIVTALSSVDLSDALARRKHVRCHRDHGNTKFQFRVFPDFDQTGGGICNTCGAFGDGFKLFEYLNGWDRKTATREVAQYLKGRGYTPRKYRELPKPEAKTFEVDGTKADALKKVWSESQPLEGTIGEEYLRSRGIDGELPNSGDVRFHPKLHYWDEDKGQSGGHYPAIVSMVRCGPMGHPLSIHRIYLDPKSGKAQVPRPKKLMPCSINGAISELGAAVRLYEANGPYIGITEGLETAMAVHSAKPELAVWAAYSAQVLTNFQPPENIKGVYIFGDVDESGTGQVASARLALRLIRKGIKARLCLPTSAIALPPADSAWYTEEARFADIASIVMKMGYAAAAKSPNLDWLDVWQESKTAVIKAFNGQKCNN